MEKIKKFLIGALVAFGISFPLYALMEENHILCDVNGSGWCCEVNDRGIIVGGCWNAR